MKRYPRSSIFWALLAMSPCSDAFAPAFSSRPQALSTVLHSSNSVSLMEKDAPGHYQTVPDFEEFASILMEPETAKLTSNALESAFEILFECSKEETVDAATRVEQLLQRFEEEGMDKLENKHYTVAVDCWTKTGHPQAGQRAEEILNRMEKLSERNPKVAPTRVTFNVVINAYAKKGDANGAYSILKRMEKTTGVNPVTKDYNACLVAFSQTGEARKAEEVMKQMVDRCKTSGSSECAPDLYAYNLLLDSWARSHEPCAGTRALEILEALESQAIHGELDLEPDERTYSSVMCSIIRSGQPGSATDAQRLFDQALSKGIVPDQYMYAALMDAYASVGDAQKAESLMNQIEEEGMANSVTYNTAMKAVRSSNAPDAAERAEAILKRMMEIDLADTISFTTTIAAYANRRDPKSAEKAQELLQSMQDLYEKGNKKVKPNVITFNAGTYSYEHCLLNAGLYLFVFF